MLKKCTLKIQFCKLVWLRPDTELLEHLSSLVGKPVAEWLPAQTGDERSGPTVELHNIEMNFGLEQMLRHSLNVWEWQDIEPNDEPPKEIIIDNQMKEIIIDHEIKARVDISKADRDALDAGYLIKMTLLNKCPKKGDQVAAIFEGSFTRCKVYSKEFLGFGGPGRKAYLLILGRA